MNFMNELSVSLLVVGYNIFAFYYARSWFRYKRRRFSDDVDRYQRRVIKLQQRHDEQLTQRLELEDKASQTLTLFEMTKAITQTRNEIKAFEIFEKFLMTHLQYDMCRLIDVKDEAIISKEVDVFIYPIKEDQNVLSYLVVNGVSKENHDVLAILAHQFALALRRVRLYQYIEKISITDELTHVHTRRYVLERLNEELSRSKQNDTVLSFLMLDVDYFKSFNDRYGHLAGDDILKQIGVLIMSQIRTIDIPGRYGGEEFCVVLPESNISGAMQVAERIRKMTDEKVFKVYDHLLHVSVSIGVVTYPTHADTPERLVERADWSLYQAKREGRNRVCCYNPSL